MGLKMQTLVLFLLVTNPGLLNTAGAEENLPIGKWQPVEVWADGKVRKPDRTYFSLFVNVRKQWSFGSWPNYPDLSDAIVPHSTNRPKGIRRGDPVLPKPLQIWSTIDSRLGIMVQSSLEGDSSFEQRVIKKYALRDNKLFVLQVASVRQKAKKWWAFAERHGDLGGGIYVGQFPAAGPRDISKRDQKSLAELKVPDSSEDMHGDRLASVMPELELKALGRPVIPKLELEVVVYERAE